MGGRWWCVCVGRRVKGKEEWGKEGGGGGVGG